MTLRVFALAALSLILPGTLWAQQVTTDSAQDSVRARRAVELTPIIVTGTVEPVPQDQLGFAASVIPENEVRAQPAPFAAQVLRRVPDVFIDEATGPGGPTVIRLRGGEEPYTKVLWDGVPINISGGFLDMQGLTLVNVERVEVARGPHSALYGSSAVSGVVQFITRRGQAGAPMFGASWEAGTASEYGTTGRGELTMRGGSRSLLYSAGGGVAYDRGIYAVAHDAWTKDFSLRLDALPSDRAELTAIGRYSDINTNLPVRDPGATRVPLDPNQRDARKRLTTSVDGRFAATEHWSHRVAVGFLRDYGFYEDMTDGITQPPTFFVADFSLVDRATTDRLAVDYVATHRFGAEQSPVTLSYGASIDRETSTDSLTGDFGNSRVTFGHTSKAALAELQAHSGPVSVLAGTRIERYPELPTQFTPRASIVIDIVPNAFSLRGAAGRSFKVPNLFQQYLDNPFTVPNPDLAPETAFSWEAGFSVTSPTTPVRAGVTYFREDYRNLIRTVAAVSDPRATNKNLGHSRAQGLELEIAYHGETVSAGANGTWLSTTVIDNSGLAPTQYPVNEELPFRPHALGNAFVQVTRGRLGLDASLRVVGSQTVLTERFGGNRATVDGYALVGARVAYDIARSFSLYVGAENLFDTFYETGFDRRGVPRRITAGARIGS